MARASSPSSRPQIYGSTPILSSHAPVIDEETQVSDDPPEIQNWLGNPIGLSHHQSQPALNDDEKGSARPERTNRHILSTDDDSTQDHPTDEPHQPTQPALNPRNEIHRWLAKAALIKEFVTDPGFFDATVVNDDLERAYEELKGVLMGEFWRTYGEDD